jgi:hypothetical protein
MLSVLRCSVVVPARLLAGLFNGGGGGRRVGLFIAVLFLIHTSGRHYILPIPIAMRYLTHLVLFQLSREVKPDRRRRPRDPFGLDAAACWCAFLEEEAGKSTAAATSAPPLSHANTSTTTTHHITCADIELQHLTPSGRSRAIVPAQDASEVTQAPWQSQMPHPRRPPTAHCRPASSKQRQHTRNNHHTTTYQTSPPSK